MTDRSPARVLPAALVLVLALALVAAAVPVAGAQEVPDGCPDPVDVAELAELADGTMLQGLTVRSGSEPEAFTAEVLGVLTDAVAPGRDLIVVELGGEAIESVGGVWAGMSGSPVSLPDGRLVGSVSYGFSVAPSRIAGLTPAGDLYDLLDREEGSETPATRVPLTGQTGLAVAQRDPAVAQQGLAPLRLPISVAGAPARSVERLQEAIDRAGLPFRATTAGVTPAAAAQAGSLRAGSAAPAAPPPPGGNAAAVLSVGDVTSGAVGTATLVCGEKTLAFGHPFQLAGGETLLASTADALAIVDDDTFGPFKLANIGPGYGTFVQDRLAGVAGPLGVIPDLIPVTSEVTDVTTGRGREGETDIVRTELVPDLAAFHLFANIDAVLETFGEGTSTLTTSVTGTGPDGTPFSLEREDAFASEFDISYETILPSLIDLFTIANAEEGVELDGVDYTTEVSPVVSTYQLDEVTVSVDGGEPVDPFSVPVAVLPGSRLDVTTTLKADGVGGEGLATEPVTTTVEVPNDATGSAFVQVRGGADPLGDIFFFGATEQQQGDLAQALADIGDRPANDELVVTVGVETGLPPLAPEGEESPLITPVAEGRTQLDRVVGGEQAFGLEVQGPGILELSRIAGPERVTTAVALSQATFPSAETVVLARGDQYADALAGAPLAASLDAPLLLTDRAGLTPEVGAEIARLGAGSAVLLGGGGALAPQVEADLVAAGLAVRRVAGDDRFATAADIAREVGGDAVYVTRGSDPDPARGWPDALGVSGLAALQGRPILLSAPEGLPAATTAVLDELTPESVTIVGGTAVVAPEIEAQLVTSAGDVDRVAGADRYETSRLLADLAVEAGANPRRTLLAAGGGFADALAAGAAAAEDEAVLLLIDGQDPDGSPTTYEFLDTLRSQFQYVRFLGGPATIAEPVVFRISDSVYGPPTPDPGAVPAEG